MQKNNSQKWFNTKIKPDQEFIETNIVLCNIFQSISQMKFPLQSSFLFPYILALRIKIIVCPENNWSQCFCTGCMIARRIKSMIEKQSWLMEGLINQSKKFTGKLKSIFSSPLSLFEIEQMQGQKYLQENQKLNLSIKQQKYMGQYLDINIERWSREDRSSIRFLPLFFIVSKLAPLIKNNLSSNIMAITQKCIQLGYNTPQSLVLYKELKNVLQKIS